MSNRSLRYKKTVIDTLFEWVCAVRPKPGEKVSSEVRDLQRHMIREAVGLATRGAMSEDVAIALLRVVWIAAADEADAPIPAQLVALADDGDPHECGAESAFDRSLAVGFRATNNDCSKVVLEIKAMLGGEKAAVEWVAIYNVCRIAFGLASGEPLVV